MSDQVIVRFPPSPTGYLQIGNARTAVFNWLFAQKTGGKFILRIEDTDVERSTEDAVQVILDSLEWLGITWDEGPYFQSEFVHKHAEAARQLIESGNAYPCFCTKEELEHKRQAALKQKTSLLYDGTCRRLTPAQVQQKEASGTPYVIRFKVPRRGGSVRFRDLVYGPIEKKHEDIEDFVIVRSNGQPLYVLSNAVDDIRDRITHVIRGQDGLANTPKQILIYEALGEEIPSFAHMAFTLDTKKAKISKRKHGEAVTVKYYREHGFLPWAFVNFISLLGWSTPDSKQIFSKEELIEAFSFEGMNKSSSVFDIRQNDPKFFTDPKLMSINAHYLRTLPLEELLPFIKAEMEKAGIWNPEFEGVKKDWFLKTIDLIRVRFHLTTDFVTLGRAYFSDDYQMEEQALKKNVLKHENLKNWLPLLAERLDRLTEFNTEGTESVIRDLAEELEVKPGILINGIRAMVTGQAVGPGLFDLLMAIGKERVVSRLKRTPQVFGAHE